jgi:hypothetical protein
MIAGLESAPATGTPHLHGYFKVQNRIRILQAEKPISQRAHFTQAMGTREHNKISCSKEGNVLILHEERKVLSKAQMHSLSLIEATRTGSRIKRAKDFPKDLDVPTLKHKNSWVGGVAGNRTDP